MQFLESALIGAGAVMLLAPQVAAQSMYSKNSPIVQVDAKSWNKLITQNHVPSIVEFYAPWCGHCKNLKPAYEKAAKSLEGIVQVAAVNCDDDLNKPLCGEQGIQGFPTLKTVVATGVKSKPIIAPYNGERSAKAIVDAAHRLLPNHVKRVEDKDLNKWLADNNDAAKAILFSDKGKTSATIKAIGNDFYGNLQVAQIRDTNQDAADMFGVDDYPTLIVLPGGDKEAVKYDGEMTKSKLTEFLKQYASVRSLSSSKASKATDSKAKKSKASKAHEDIAKSHASGEASGAPRSAASETVEDSGEESPKPTLEDVPKPVKVPSAVEPLVTLATQAELKETCLGAKTQTCLLALLPASEEEAESRDGLTAILGNLATLQEKLHRGEQHIFPFYVVPAENEMSTTLKKSLALAEDGLELITVNGKKGWWRHYDSKKGFEVLAIEDWIDAIKFGEIKKGKIPAGLVGEIAEPKDEDKSEL